MSMLTGQADELRKAALIQGAHARYDVANLLTDAADTILSLRYRVRELRAENAKLRKLVRWMYDRMDESCAVHHPYVPAPISYDRLMQAIARARELGIEVEE